MTKPRALTAAVLIQVKQVRKERDFVMLPNSIFRDRKLDWDDLGMLTDLLHLHPDQLVSLQWVAARRPSREFRVRSITKRLQALGYMRCTAERDDLGRVTRWTWEVCEWPVPEWATEYADRIDERMRRRAKAREGVPERDFYDLEPSRTGFASCGGPQKNKLKTSSNLR